jgi:predicted Zn-dependent peptidase
MKEFKLHTLKNGIKTLIVPVDNKKIVSIIIKIKCGFYNEINGINNYTHLLEHLIASFLNKEQCSMKSIKELINNKVLKTNAYTTDNELCFWVECYYSDIEFFINLMSRSLFNLCITHENLDMAKKNVIKELQQSEDVYLMNDINTYLFRRKKVSFHYGIKDVNNVSIRSMENFYKKVLSKEIIIAITCDEQYINKINKLIIVSFDKPIVLVKDDLNITFKAIYPFTHKIMKHYKPIKSVAINIIIPIRLTIDTIEYYSIKIFLKYLFNFENGELYKILRHSKKIIYNINFNITTDDIDPNKSYVEITSTCQKSNLDEFIKTFYDIFNNFTIDNDMFKTFKQHLLFNSEYNYMIGFDAYTNYYMDSLFYNRKILTLDNKIKLIKSITYMNTLKILKNFKSKKHLIFLYNKKYKKQKD